MAEDTAPVQVQMEPAPPGCPDGGQWVNDVTHCGTMSLAVPCVGICCAVAPGVCCAIAICCMGGIDTAPKAYRVNTELGPQFYAPTGKLLQVSKPPNNAGDGAVSTVIGAAIGQVG
eukprot:gb/GFBE01077092.1/.p1 GENE.gb/GFBE01077092.1/~~gb/GFBE01077092.1/.p1  ORF type:complete len:116 (+),score=19.12 gb/GFBE01077092.1/:1-348(+)